jgi:hypothetical protein
MTDSILDVIKYNTLQEEALVLAKGQTLSHQLVLCIQGKLVYKKDKKELSGKYGNIGELDIYELLSNKAPDDIIGI